MTPNKTTPKDFFLHLGATIALYVTAIALMNLAFTIINRAFPDALNSYWSASSVIWPVSLLIVLVPLLYVLEWLIRRDINRMPERKDIWVRRWRIYLTLFLTGATIAGDLVYLISTYLNGEITTRFILKVVVVLVVCAVIFAYYIFERMRDTGQTGSNQKALAWLGIILVIAGIVGGFIIVGSPYTQRALRFDQQRINDLNSIQYQVTNFWQRTGKLPDSINSLNDALSNFNIPKDPETGKDYEYLAKPPSQFTLCANFDLLSDTVGSTGTNMPMPMLGNGQTNWKHDSGRTCFDRTIDSTRYPPTPVPKTLPY